MIELVFRLMGGWTRTKSREGRNFKKGTEGKIEEIPTRIQAARLDGNESTITESGGNTH